MQSPRADRDRRPKSLQAHGFGNPRPFRRLPAKKCATGKYFSSGGARSLDNRRRYSIGWPNMSNAPSATADELFTRGNQAADGCEWTAAAALYEQALRIEPKHVMALNNLGYCHVRLGEPDLGVLYLNRCLALKRDVVLALVNIVEAVEAAGREFEAILHLRSLVDLQPETAQHAFKLANLLSGAGRMPEALYYYRQALARNPRHQAWISNYLLALNYADGLSIDYIAAEHFRLGAMWSEEHSAAAFAPIGNPQQQLRIAYLSGDFHTHPDGKTLAPIMAAHDRSRHVVYAYSDGKRADGWPASAAACFTRKMN